MYCGAAIPEAHLSEETKNRLRKEKNDSYKSPNASSTKATGALLIIIGILADVISMFMIFSSDVEAFGIVTIGGTICFVFGLVLFSNG